MTCLSITKHPAPCSSSHAHGPGKQGARKNFLVGVAYDIYIYGCGRSIQSYNEWFGLLWCFGELGLAPIQAGFFLSTKVAKACIGPTAVFWHANFFKETVGAWLEIKDTIKKNSKHNFLGYIKLLVQKLEVGR